MTKEYSRHYYLNNKEQFAVRSKKYYLKNKKSLKIRHKNYYLNNKEWFKIYIRNYYLKNKAELKIKVKEYYLKNKEQALKLKKEYSKKNILKIRIYQQKYKFLKRKTDLICHIKDILRTSLLRALKKHNLMKKNSALVFLGQSIEDFKKHLEQQFKDGMTWDNWGVYKENGKTTWHIDHIIPCSKFDLTKEEEQKKCFHYTNLQPLWAIDNLKKGNRLK